MPLKNEIEYSASKLLTLIAITLSTCVLLLQLASFFVPRKLPATTTARETSLDRIRKTGVMKVAYGGFPPYTIVNPDQSDPNKRVSGFVVDMVNEIAERSSPKLKIEWYNLNWETFKADMDSAKFDFVADAVYATVPKAQDFRLTEPFSYFGLAVAVVRKDDDRFKNFEDLDRSDITIALAQGYVSTEYAQRELKKPNFKFVAVGKDAFTQLDEVLFKRADVALNDVPTVVQYVTAHEDQVKALWIQTPPSWAVASFVTNQKDADLDAMLSADIRLMKTDGTLEKLDKKWRSLGFFDKPHLVPGVGLAKYLK